MENVPYRCEDCCKKEVCKYADDMGKLTHTINEQLRYVSTTRPWSIAGINCDYFEVSKPTTKGW